MDNALGLVMTGGGARGAYQAGVLKRIGEIKSVQAHGNPFPIIGGSSAGAVNGCGLAVGCDDFSLATGSWLSSGPNSGLPIFFAAMHFRRRAIRLHGFWISPLEQFWAEGTHGRCWMHPRCGIFSIHISTATESKRTLSADISTRWPSRRPTTTRARAIFSFRE